MINLEMIFCFTLLFLTLEPRMPPLFRLLCLLLLVQYTQAQTITQTIRGSVTDADNNRPLSGATVQLINTNVGTSTDAGGSFSLPKTPIGRYGIQVSSVGYETIMLPEVLLEAGKERVLIIALKQKTTQLTEAVVRTTRPVAQGSIQSITTEQTLRYAATFLDPARLATSFAGVVAANDQANGIVIRGNSPNGTQWRLEGVEIVNPNHLSNAGSFSDRPTQTGGGTTILSTQLMERADFLTGAFPAEYGNALAGVMDVHLRKGNNQRHELTGQAGLIGVDLAAEGPISKKSKASYLVNYRYSFTGLLATLGVKLGDEDIRYQDLSFNLTFPTKAGTFTVFGMGGISSNNFDSPPDTSAWKVQKDGFDIYFKNRMGAIGLTHTLNLGQNTTWRTTVAASALETIREGYIHSRANTANRFLIQYSETAKTRYSLSTSLTHKMGGWQLREGIYLTRQIDSVEINQNGLSRGRTDGIIAEPYIALTGHLAPRLTLQAGVHYLYYSYNKTQSLEPRASLRFAASERSALTLSYGLHSQLQLPQLYLSIKNSNTIFREKPNVYLEPTKAHHIVLGFERQLKAQTSLKIEAYYQALYNVPVASQDPTISFRVLPAFSALNLEEGFVDAPLANRGTGRNYGVEATYQQFLSNNYYLLLTGSLYNSTYKGQDEVVRNTRYNGNHTLSLTGGKELKRRPNRTFGVNVRLLWLGGFRDSPIDEDASRGANTTVYKIKELYSIKLADYFRPDVRLYWKKNKPGFTRTWSVDIQNLTNTQNEAYSYYDVLQRKVIKKYQLGLIPVLSYRVEF
jgi:CarboxypepD_reg-like domain/TonB-dependent Receptor Plug Domain